MKKLLTLLTMLTIFSMPVLAHAEGNVDVSSGARMDEAETMKIDLENYRKVTDNYSSKKVQSELDRLIRKDNPTDKDR